MGDFTLYKSALHYKEIWGKKKNNKQTKNPSKNRQEMELITPALPPFSLFNQYCDQ